MPRARCLVSDSSSFLTRLAVTVRIPCGGRENPVTILLEAQGTCEVRFNPCQDILPAAFRRGSGCTCHEAIPAIRAAVEQQLQYVWHDASPPPFEEVSTSASKKIHEFLDAVARHRPEVATTILHDRALEEGDRIHTEDRGQDIDWAEALQSTDESRRWAAIVLGGNDPRFCEAVLPNILSWPLQLVLAAACIAEPTADKR